MLDLLEDTSDGSLAALGGTSDFCQVAALQARISNIRRSRGSDWAMICSTCSARRLRLRANRARAGRRDIAIVGVIVPVLGKVDFTLDGPLAGPVAVAPAGGACAG